jgi:hypothetical protein
MLPIDSDQKDIGTKFNRASFETAYEQTLNTSGVTKDRSMTEFSANFERAQTGFNFGLGQT